MSTKKQSQKAPSAAKAMSQLEAKLLFAKLVKESKTMDEAWRRVRKFFPKKQWGRVREIVQKLSKYPTLRAAYAAMHKSKKAQRAA